MELLEKLVLPRFSKLLSVNLLTVKDYSAFEEVSTSRYLTTTSGYLNKLYKSIGLKSLSFMSNLQELDPVFTVSKITEYLRKLKLSIYLTDNEFFVMNEQSYKNYMDMISLANNTFTTMYAHESDDYSDDSYLLLDKSVGIYIEVSLLSESVVVYDAEIIDNSLYLSKNATYELTDPEFMTFIRMHFSTVSNSKASLFYNNLINTPLVWSEVVQFRKSLHQKFLLTDEDNTTLYNMTDLQKQSIVSPYTVSDFVKWSYDAVLSIKLQDISWIYNKISNEDLKFFQLS